jgi:tRNA A-37 threonylcarbamoyl transferase component Bud32
MHEDAPSRLGECLSGKYRLDALLGAGGMGEVYRATHLVLGKTVAIKLLRPELAHDRDVVTRFLREAKASILVRHRNVVEVLDVGSDDDGTPYIVQEHLQGEDFGSLLARHPEGVPPGLAMSVLLPVVDAVAAAHDRGVVHRDLKPENVFLAQEGGLAVPKVLDFGISKLPESDAASTRLTAADTLMGSPQYMSPEQIQTPRAVDQRSDIWSLGVMLFECLTGRLPFDAATPELLFIKICRERPLSLEEVAPHLPAELSRLVARCLEPDPARRFANALELHDALKQLRTRPSGATRPEARSGMRSPAPNAAEPPPPPARAAVGAGFGTRVSAEVGPDAFARTKLSLEPQLPGAFELGATARGSVRPRREPAARGHTTRVDADATAVDPAETPRDPARTPAAALRPPRQQLPARRSAEPQPAPRAPMPEPETAPEPAPAPEPEPVPDSEPDLYPIGALDAVLGVLVVIGLALLVPAVQGGRAADGVRLLGNELPLWGLGVAAALVLACTRTAMLALDNRSYALFAAALGLLVLPGCFVILSTSLGWPRSPLAAQAPLATRLLPWAALAVHGGYAAHGLRRIVAAFAARRR